MGHDLRRRSAKALGDLSCCFLGDARNNVANSLLAGGRLLGVDVRLCAPESSWPAPKLVSRCHDLAAQTGARLTVTADVDRFLHCPPAFVTMAD